MATLDKDFKVKNGLQVTDGGSFGGTVSVATPTLGTHATTKDYVDAKPGGYIVSETPPEDVTQGAGWYKSSTGQTYIYYDNFWVEEGNGTGGEPGPTGPTGATGPTGPGISGVTASASELNILDGTTVTTTELNYVNGVTSSIQTQLDGKAAVSHTHNASAITYTIEDKSANYSIVSSDEGKVIRSTGSAITVTVDDVFAIGELATFTQYGAGQISFVPGSGVTLHSVDSKRKTNKQYSTVQIMKTQASTYLLFGDIVA